MGNQARQRQELELWQVVTPLEKRTRQVNARYAGQAGNRNKVNTAAPRKRTGVSKTAAQVRPIYAVKTAGSQRAARLIHTGYQRNRVNVQALRRQKIRRRQIRIYRCIAAVWIMALTVTMLFLGKLFFQNIHVEEKKGESFESVFKETPFVDDNSDAKKPQIQEDFLTVSEYNRPGTKLGCVNNIFVHYTANPGTSAAQNRSYFENLGETHERAASAHFIIGYEGEIIQCIPLEEEAYAVVDRNKDSISIECCFIKEDGSFTQETYDSLVAMLAWLTDKYHLEAKDILRHYDCGGKLCPIYYVEHEDAWDKLLYDVENYKL